MLPHCFILLTLCSYPVVLIFCCWSTAAALIMKNISATTEITAVHYCATVLHAAFMGLLPGLSDLLNSDCVEYWESFYERLWVSFFNLKLLLKPALVDVVVVSHIWNIWLWLWSILEEYKAFSCKIYYKLPNSCTVIMNYAGSLFCSCSVIGDWNSFFYRCTQK